MSDEILLHRLDAMSIAESNSTAVGANYGGYNSSMNQFRPGSIAPSSHDGSLNCPDTPSTGFFNAADAQPMAVATGKPSPLKNEIRGYELGRYSPNVGHHSPSQFSSASSSQYASDTQSQQSPPFASGYESHRSSSSNTVRPPVRSPRGSPNTSTNTNSPSPRPSPKFTSPTSNSDSSSSAQSHTSTQSVTGGHLALFNQMATQKQEQVEWKISSSGPPHKPRFDAQVFGKSHHSHSTCSLSDGLSSRTVRNYCHGRGQALTKKQAQQSAAEAALRSLGWM